MWDMGGIWVGYGWGGMRWDVRYGWGVGMDVRWDVGYERDALGWNGLGWDWMRRDARLE